MYKANTILMYKSRDTESYMFHLQKGCPMLFSYQKSHFGFIMEAFEMKMLVCFSGIWNIFRPLGIGT
jgi:hypothetical protein